MQENYKEMKKRHQNEFDTFPLKAAFTDDLNGGILNDRKTE